MNWVNLIGQFFGILAVILGFVSFQMPTQKKVLIAQIATSVVFIIHYILIGATSAVWLNLVGLFRNIAYFSRESGVKAKFLYSRNLPIVFAVIMAIMGVLSWENVYSLLIIFGITINTICLSFKNPQNLRKSILISSPLVLLYDVVVISVGGIVYESVAIISSIIGIIRFRKGKEISAEVKAQ